MNEKSNIQAYAIIILFNSQMHKYVMPVSWVLDLHLENFTKAW
jgi:hypothetical protein